MNRLGFIGMGNMAQAIASGFIEKNILSAESISAYAPNAEKLDANALRIGFVAVHDIEELVNACDTIIMACKPYQIESVLEQIGSKLSGKTLISIALGWNYSKYMTYLSGDVRVQFVMPNTPAQIGEGVFLFEKSNSLTAKDRMQIMDAFSKLGLVREMPDELMGIGGAITGCGPAFVDLFIEALGDAAVKYGIPRAAAYELVSQTIAGSAKLQLETGTHPGVLKDAVCSPGGSTIRGVTAMEEAGFRAATMAAIDSIMKK